MNAFSQASVKKYGIRALCQKGFESKLFDVQQKICKTGADQLHSFIKKEGLKKSRTAVLCHPASLTRAGEHIVDILEQHTRLTTLFGPQHGIFGETQDNMIEWQDRVDEKSRPVYSLYGERRSPEAFQLKDADVVFVDLFDIGARYYTFIYSMSYMLQLCLREKIRIIILDRPNPLGGEHIEGPILDPIYRSFVGLHLLPVCHGMTIGELSHFFANELELPNQEYLSVLPLKAWPRKKGFEETGLLWPLPSPNMPNLEAARFFPGMCLLEATSLSEGRGTTRPFELIGAPFIDWGLIWKEYLNLCKSLDLSPASFIRQGFIPTFHKYHGELCHGALQRAPKKFFPLRHGVILLWLLRKHYGDKWTWKQPPYEYELEKLPIDILAGGPQLREFIDEQKSLKKLFQHWKDEEKTFRRLRRKFLLYR